MFPTEAHTSTCLISALEPTHTHSHPSLPPSLPFFQDSVFSTEAHTSTCLVLAMDPTHQHLALGSTDGLVSIWGLEELLPLRTMDRLNTAVSSLDFSYDGRWLAGMCPRVALLPSCPPSLPADPVGLNLCFLFSLLPVSNQWKSERWFLTILSPPLVFTL